jgi:hypothetical protein
MGARRGRITITLLAAGLGAASLSMPGLAQASMYPTAATPPTVRGWGENDEFALGSGSNKADSLAPVKVKLSATLDPIAIGSGPAAERAFAITVVAVP